MRLPLVTAFALALACSAASARDFWNRDNAPGNVLKADQAFRLMPVEARGKTLRVEWQIAPGYYLYRGRIKLEPLQPADARLGTLKLPAGEHIRDEHFGEVEIYRSGALVGEFSGEPVPRRLRLTYQGCAEEGLCLPPQTRVVDVQVLP